MLSDTEKRRQYDLYGPMEERTSRPRYVHMYIIFTEISYSTETHVLLLFFLLFDLTNFFFIFFCSRGRHGFYEHDPTHGFESDMTAEEIFNMFFGGSKCYYFLYS